MEHEFDHIHSECDVAANLARDSERVRGVSMPALLRAGMTLTRGLVLARQELSESDDDRQRLAQLRSAHRVILEEIRQRDAREHLSREAA